MKKTVLLSTLVCGSLLMGAASTALAEDHTVKTSGHVEFQIDDEKTDPEEPPTGGENPDPDPGEGGEGGETPEKPGKPVEPEEKPEENNNDGQLTIDFASSFEFRKQNIKATAQTFYANVQEWTKGAEESYYTPNFVQVTDKRAGDIKGWTLDVALASPLTNKNNQHTLDKAQIKLEERRVVSLWDTTEENENKPAQLVGTQEKAPELGSVVSISKEGQSIMTATAGTGWGTSQTYFSTVAPEDVSKGDMPYDKNTEEGEVTVKGAQIGAGDQGVSLNIPAGTNIHEGDYTAKILWSLTDAPK